MSWLQNMQFHEILLFGCVFGIPLFVIIVQGVVTISKQTMKHRERMAMIEQGIDPDNPDRALEYVSESPDMKETKTYVRQS